MKRINDKQFAAVVALPAPERYQHFIAQVVDGEEIWSLRSESGWVMAGDSDGRELVPVWPHPRYAEACAVENWEGSRPEAIPLERWLEAWTPGMIRDKRAVAVFPIPRGQGVPVSPERLRDDLQAECEKFE